MIYTETKLKGSYIVELEPLTDSRGFFAYLFDSKQAEHLGLATKVVQMKLSYNKSRGTLRGMHLQLPPAAETKFVRCLRGSVWDVIVDLRESSPTYLQSIGVELSGENKRALYVPPLFAHGYQTLTDDAEVMYSVDEFYSPQHEKGLRYDDPKLKLSWPIPVKDISPKDAAWPLL